MRDDRVTWEAVEVDVLASFKAQQKGSCKEATQLLLLEDFRLTCMRRVVEEGHVTIMDLSMCGCDHYSLYLGGGVIDLLLCVPFRV